MKKKKINLFSFFISCVVDSVFRSSNNAIDFSLSLSLSLPPWFNRHDETKKTKKPLSFSL